MGQKENKKSIKTKILKSFIKSYDSKEWFQFTFYRKTRKALSFALKVSPLAVLGSSTLIYLLMTSGHNIHPDFNPKTFKASV